MGLQLAVCAQTHRRKHPTSWSWRTLARFFAFHRCSHPLSLSPRGEKTNPPGKDKKEALLLSLSLSLSLYWVKERAEIGTGHFVWRGNYLSHEASRICPVYRGARSAAPFQWISIQWKYPGNLTIVNSHQLKKLRSNKGFCFPRRGKTMILAVFYVLLPVLGKFKLIRTSNCSLRIDNRVSSNI